MRKRIISSLLPLRYDTFPRFLIIYSALLSSTLRLLYVQSERWGSIQTVRLSSFLYPVIIMCRWIICLLLPVKGSNYTTTRTARALTDRRLNSSSGRLIVRTTANVAGTTKGRSRRRYRIQSVMIKHTRGHEEMVAVYYSITSIISQESTRVNNYLTQVPPSIWTEIPTSR